MPCAKCWEKQPDVFSITKTVSPGGALWAPRRCGQKHCIDSPWAWPQGMETLRKMGIVLKGANWLAEAAGSSCDFCKELGFRGMWLEQGESVRGGVLKGAPLESLAWEPASWCLKPPGEKNECSYFRRSDSRSRQRRRKQQAD